MMCSSSAMRSAGMMSEMWRPTACVGRVAEEALGGSVPALDDPVERLADDGVVRGFDDRREQTGREEFAGLVRIQAALRGDVSENQHASGRRGRARRVIGAALSSIGTLAAVLPNQQRVIREADDDPVPKGFRRRILDRQTRVLVDDPKHCVERLADRFCLHPPGQRFGDGVHVRDAAVDVGGDDGVADAAQRHPQQLALLVGAHLRASHRLAEPDDEETGEQVGQYADHMPEIDDGKAPSRFDEEVVTRDVPGDR